VIVAATSGAMGGSASEEFLAVAETGEDTFVRSPGGYAANVEAVTTTRAPGPSARRAARGAGPPHAGHADHRDAGRLPERPASGRTFTAADTLKNVLLKTRQPGSDEWTLLGIGVPGDREVDMKRLEAALDPAEVALLDEADFARTRSWSRATSARALAANGVRFLVDPRIVTGTAWVTGADKPDHHVVDLVPGRDFTPDGTIEAAEVREGDPAPTAPARSRRPAASRSGTCSSSGASTPTPGPRRARPDGKPVRITMGSYGIGVSRLVAAIAEQNARRTGLVWPRAVRRPTCTWWSRARARRSRPAASAGRRARRGRLSGAARRPQGLAGVKFARRRAGRRAHDRRRRARHGRRQDRGQGPPPR
jgi:prolyl-tRNA synthetase